MKRKTKLVSSIAAATAVAAGAAGFSTYAWLATTRDVQGDIYKLSVDTTSTDLEINKWDKLTNDDAAMDDTVTVAAGEKRHATGTNATLSLGDATSGNGVDVYKPHWRPSQADKQADAIAAKRDKATIAYYGYKLTASAASAGAQASGGLDVYLSGLTITATKAPGVDQTRSEELAKNIRVAVITISDNDDTHGAAVEWGNMTAGSVEKSFVYQNKLDGADANRRNQYIRKAAQGETTVADEKDEHGVYQINQSADRGAWGVKGFKLEHFPGKVQKVEIEGINTFWQNEESVGGQDPAKTIDERKEQSNYVCTIKGGESRYITIGMWLEGSLKVNQLDSTKGGVDLHFGLTSFDSVANFN